MKAKPLIGVQCTPVGDENKSSWVKLRLSPLEKAVFERAARLEGMSVSTLLRTSARREAARILMAAGERNPFIEPDKSRRPRRKT